MTNVNLDFNNLSQIGKAGFEGFLTKAQLFQNSSMIPDVPGVYLVLSLTNQPPNFLETGTGGYFKGKNPNVHLSELALNWVDEAKVVYIGKATSLRVRLRQYFRFGQGKNVGHWGGRYIWQLNHSRDLVVCWMPTPNESPKDVETALIQSFKHQYGSRPFANLTD